MKKVTQNQENIFHDLSDLSPVEKQCFNHWNSSSKTNEDCHHSSFNLDHFRKVKEARLSIK